MIHKVIKILLFVLGLAMAVELLLRIFGFGNPPLYISDKQFEYIYAPGQNLFRFGNRILINEYGMRSKPLEKGGDEITILKIGDSVINGGAPTDHDNLSSSILEKKLQKKFKKKIRVLNVSAGSWGPDNGMAFIKKQGHFNASKIILVFSSHDLYDMMTFEEIIGKNIHYPDKKPVLAILEAFERYLINDLLGIGNNQTEKSTKLSPELELGNAAGKINPGWFFFPDYCKNNNLDLLVILHPTKEELSQKEYNINGKQIIHILDSLNVPYILELKNGIRSEVYRDNIHLNNDGQKFLADIIYPELSNYIERKLNAEN